MGEIPTHYFFSKEVFKGNMITEQEIQLLKEWADWEIIDFVDNESSKKAAEITLRLIEEYQRLLKLPA